MGKMSDNFADYELQGSVSMTTSTPVSVVAAFSEDSLERLDHDEAMLRDVFEPIPITATNSTKDKDSHGLDMDHNEMNARRRRTRKCESPPGVRRSKKPKGMPKRPLTAFSLFFQKLRAIAMEKEKFQGKINLEDLSKKVEKKWRELSERERKHYEELAYHDANRYRREMEDYNNQGKEKKRSHVSHRNYDHAYSYELPPPPSTAYHPSSWYGPPRSPTVHETSFAPALQQPLQPMQHGHPYSGQNFGNHYPFLPHAHSAKPPPLPGQQPPPPVLEEVRNAFPIPPGMEVFLPDLEGIRRRYRVKYACFSMTRDAALKYMQELTGDFSTNFPLPEAAAGDLGLPLRRTVGGSSPQPP